MYFCCRYSYQALTELDADGLKDVISSIDTVQFNNKALLPAHRNQVQAALRAVHQLAVDVKGISRITVLA